MDCKRPKRDIPRISVRILDKTRIMYVVETRLEDKSRALTRQTKFLKK